MARHKIKFVIDPDGTVTHEVIGSLGTDCVKETAWIDQALGGAPVKRTYKPEYYKPKQAVKIAEK